MLIFFIKIIEQFVFVSKYGLLQVAERQNQCTKIHTFLVDLFGFFLVLFWIG